MNTYETLFITLPDLTEEDEKATVDALAAIVTDGGGTMIAHDRMGRRRLAYPIHKVEDGVYTRLLYDSESAVPQELERRFRLSDKVLRALTVHLRDEWADDAKKQAVIDAERRVQAEIEAKAKAEADAAEAEAKAKAEAEAAEKGETAEGGAASDEASEAAPTDESAETAEAAPTDGAEAPAATESASTDAAADGSDADGSDEVK